MREELERAIRELESKLPELRRLVAMAEMELTLSPAASALAPVLVNLLRVTDETASDLRRALLEGVEPVAPPEPPPVSNTGSGISSGGGEAMSEAERELAELMGDLSGVSATESDYWNVVPPEEPASPTTETDNLPTPDLRQAAADTSLDLTPTTFADAERVYRKPLWDAVWFYLEDDRETDIVVNGAMEQSARVFEASEGEINPLEVFARTAAYQVQLLLPRQEDRPDRREPSERQLFLHLELFRMERLIERKREQVERLRAASQESETDVSAILVRLESELTEMLNAFYNYRLRLDDEDKGGEGGAIGVPPDEPPPVRDPGAGRTFEEALALPRLV
jgi:hypothetical protein